MKKAIFSTSIACLAILFLVIGCKKSDTMSTPTAAEEAVLAVQVSQTSSDQTIIENDNDAIATDATKATETVPGFNSSTKVTGLFGAPADSTKDSASYRWFVIDRSPIARGFKRMLLRYLGLREDNGLTKQGYITIELIKGTKWTDSGAVLKETDSVSITYRDGKTRIYQNTRYVTNVSGGYYNIKNKINPFVYTMHSSGSVTFENGTMRTYWIARRNTFSKTPPYPFTTDGDTTYNGSKCTIGGTTRFGTSFWVESPQAISSSTQFGYSAPTTGIRKLNNSGVSPVTLTFGVDSTGNQVAAGIQPYGYKISWTKLNGQSGIKIIAY